MNFYLIHCGYYDEEISDGIYEFHINLPIVAENLNEAKMKVRSEIEFKKRRMHIDGIQEIKFVTGYRIELIYEPDLINKTEITNHLQRDF